MPVSVVLWILASMVFAAFGSQAVRWLILRARGTPVAFRDLVKVDRLHGRDLPPYPR